ncbi:MAG: YitT family protein [Clostridia bacterium]|nr:YitT family protein [Clostridia bacterium]
MKKLKWQNFVLLTVAGIINSIGVTIFLAPVNLFDSGMSGTAMLLNNITPEFLTLSVFLIVLNFPFYIIGYKKLGLDFVIYSLYAIAVYSIMSFLFQSVLPIDFTNGSPITGQDRLLTAIFGGLISGIGSGLVIRFGGAIDGVEVIAVLTAKKIGITVGTFVMIYNVILYTVSALVYSSWEIPLYSVIAYMVGIKAVDFIVEGLDKAKAVYIITEKTTQLPQMLSEELGRGVTILDAQGVYSRNRKTMIYCVVNRFEINRVKRLVKEVDDSAFVTVNDISETVGGSSMRWRLNR